MIPKVILLALVSASSVYCGVLPSNGYFFNQGPVYHPGTISSFQPVVAHYPAPSFVQVQRPQQVTTVSRPQFVAIHAERPPTVVTSQNYPARPVPVQSISSNVVAIHAQRPVQPATRKIVLPYPPAERVASPDYHFEYAVNDQTTGDEKSHQETRVGDNVVGRYTVVEPDGTLRVVNYTAGKDGFNAVVEKTPNYAPPNAPVKVVSKPVAVASPVSGTFASAVAIPSANLVYPNYPSGFHFGG